MSSRFTNAELREMARTGTDAEAGKAIELLEARGELPEDSFEERRGQTYNESRRMV